MHTIIFLGALTLVCGCASSSDDVAVAPCVIDGTYTIQGTAESGTCATVYADTPPQQVALTLATVNGVTKFALTGLTGAPVARVTACKVDAAIDYTVTSATVPAANTGTLQYSLNIDKVGAVTGFYSLSSPAVTNDGTGKARDACTGTYNVSGRRR